MAACGGRCGVFTTPAAIGSNLGAEFALCGGECRLGVPLRRIPDGGARGEGLGGIALYRSRRRHGGAEYSACDSHRSMPPVTQRPKRRKELRRKYAVLVRMLCGRCDRVVGECYGSDASTLCTWDDSSDVPVGSALWHLLGGDGRVARWRCPCGADYPVSGNKLAAAFATAAMRPTKRDRVIRLPVALEVAQSQPPGFLGGALGCRGAGVSVDHVAAGPARYRHQPAFGTLG